MRIAFRLAEHSNLVMYDFEYSLRVAMNSSTRAAFEASTAPRQCTVRFDLAGDEGTESHLIPYHDDMLKDIHDFEGMKGLVLNIMKGHEIQGFQLRTDSSREPSHREGGKYYLRCALCPKKRRHVADDDDSVKRRPNSYTKRAVGMSCDDTC
jgi:hypothetical protein